MPVGHFSIGSSQPYERAALNQHPLFDFSWLTVSVWGAVGTLSQIDRAVSSFPKKTSEPFADLSVVTATNNRRREIVSIQQNETQNSKQSPAQKAKETAAEAAEQLVDKTERATSEAIDAARLKADEMALKSQSQMHQVVRSIGRAIDAGSASLERDGMLGTAGYARAAARGISSAADEVDSFNPKNVTVRVEHFVRDKPLAAAGILAVAGFALASFVNTRSGK